VPGLAREPQALCLQRQRSAAREGVVEGGESLSVEQLLGPRMIDILCARGAPTVPDLIACVLQHCLVGGVLPLHEVFNNAKQSLALFLLFLLRWEQVRMC